MFAFINELFQKKEQAESTPKIPNEVAKEEKSATEEAVQDIGEGLLGASQAEVDAQKPTKEKDESEVDKSKTEKEITKEDASDREMRDEAREETKTIEGKTPDCNKALENFGTNITKEEQVENSSARTFSNTSGRN